VRHTARRLIPVLVVAALAVALSLPSASASVTPGTPPQVAALVAAAPSITTLPTNVLPPLATAGSDDALTAYPSLTPCVSDGDHEPACVFGDVHGSKTMVLYGDSHALMWFPALDAIATAARWRLVALMNYGCPVANVSVWDVFTNRPLFGCAGFRTHTIRRIKALDPSLVIVSEAFYSLDAQDKPITDAAWTKALASSLHALHGKRTRTTLIGQSYLLPTPLACLAAYPNAIQTCSRKPATTFAGELLADRAAAKATSTAYVSELPWLCAATCTAVVGGYIVYQSSGHLSTTYVDYLRDVLKLALRPSMR
jgi:hypothetical protein